jgi:hypothetical protein
MKNRWKFFRWTPRVARIGFMYAIFTPAVMAYVFYKTDVCLFSLPQNIPSERLDFEGKTLKANDVSFCFSQGKYYMRGKLRGDTIKEW